MLMIRLKAASSVSVMLFASPHQAKQLVKRMNGSRLAFGINRDVDINVFCL